MKILITGGAGYLGSIIVPKLISEGHHVTVLDNFMYRQFTLADCCQHEGFQMLRGDCRDEAVMKPLIAKHDLIIPLAALVGAPLCDRDHQGAVSINRDAVRMICKNVSKDQLMIYPNTNSGYGIGDKDAMCTEESPLKPISLYGVTKVEAEESVLSRENSITFRLATVFGMSSRMRLDLLVNDFVYRAYHDRAVVIFEGHFRRNYIHIRDVADAFLHAINHFSSMKGRCYNAGLDDANYSKLQLCAKIKEHLPKFVFMEAPIGEDVDKRDYIVSNARLEKAGFKAKRNLDFGIKELIKGLSMIKQNAYGNV